MITGKDSAKKYKINFLSWMDQEEQRKLDVTLLRFDYKGTYLS